ncbi:hypothetical protein Taro_000417 [Colocasia esculenta]|uniref:Uncharacterized protein n=1 Tax=Colocasia esculenta TaxID=4460 RepID=A0A843TBZ2_COLES|nr:hypothetical protein [Colocasia esculenta]
MGFLEWVRCAYAKKASRPEGAGEATPLDRTPKCAAAAAAGKERRRHRQAAPHWRPSLGAISENGGFRLGDAAEGEKRTGARAAAPEKTKKAALTLANTVARARRWGSSSRAFAAQQTAVPALASMPFLF